jgi:hypothetical protein
VAADVSLPFRQLLRAAPVAVIGCALSGLISSAFYALVPAWMQGEGIVRETIALFMLVAVLGGLAFLAPVSVAAVLVVTDEFRALGHRPGGFPGAMVVRGFTLPATLPAPRWFNAAESLDAVGNAPVTVSRGCCRRCCRCNGRAFRSRRQPKGFTATGDLPLEGGPPTANTTYSPIKALLVAAISDPLASLTGGFGTAILPGTSRRGGGRHRD